jgi:MinD-like ATPase involved in chromosome partitioning or flagellar assembly
MSGKTSYKIPQFEKETIIIVGGYGSGKSEISVNLARLLAQSRNEPVAIADLDIINPYFRSREAALELRQLGIRVIIPPGEQAYAEIPIIIPEVRQAIEDHEGKLILDVGGDDTGARVLSSLYDAISAKPYDLLLVLNANRPFTADIKGCRKIISEIEKSSRLKFTGIISNSHMMEATSKEIILEGLKLADEVSQDTKLPIKFVSAIPSVLDEFKTDEINVPVLTLDRSLLKPWERRSRTK